MILPSCTASSVNQRPTELKSDSKRVRKLWKELYLSDPVQAIVRFSTGRSTCYCHNQYLLTLSSSEEIMETLCPQALQESDGVLDEIRKRDDSLPKLPGSFAAATFNVGGRAWTIPHLDYLNLASWFCAITALGTYDSRKGGHLILWELMMVIEFPPGSTIFIPSALITHSNVPISDGERTSVVQYSAAGLFRYVHCGYKTLKSFKAAQPAEFAEYEAGAKQRATNALEFFHSLGKMVGLGTDKGPL